MESVTNYSESIKVLKSAILLSRYKAASFVNKELLLLYFAVGKFISDKTKKEKWGAKVIDNLSNDLQNELPGLKGFSSSNIKRVRFFYESWKAHILISQTVLNQLENIDLERIKFSPTALDQLENYFFKLSFSHHVELIQATKALDEKIFVLPVAYKGLLLDVETLKKLMD